MPFTRHAIYGDASAWHDAPLVGLSGRIEHNLGSQSIADEKGRLGSTPLSFSGGAFSVDMPATDDAAVVAQVTGTLQYRVVLNFTDPGGGGRRTWDSGWFSLLADVNVFEVDGAVSPEAAASGAAFLSQMQDLLDQAMAPTDTQVAGLVGNPASETGAALSETIAGAQGPILDDLRAVQSGPDYYTTTRPIISFVDDDADPLFFDIWDVIADEKNIEISVAAVAGRVAGVFNPVGFPSMTLSELQAVRAKGHDILSHGWEHLASYDAGYSAATLYTDWATARDWFIANLPEAPEAADVLVYPGGLGASDVAKKGSARRLYRYGITTSAPIGASSGNREPVDQFGVYRFNLDTGTEAAAKAAIDSAVALGTWLIFMTHDKELDSGGRVANMNKIRAVIDYAVAQNVPIMKFTEAERIKGNAISIGEFTDQNRSTVVSRRGARRHTGAQGSWTPRLYGSTTAGTHTYNQQKGYYQVNGGMVTVKASISIPSAGLDAAMAGNLRIDGLPSAFMPSALDVAAVAPCNYNIFNLGTNYTGVWAKSGGAHLNLLRGGNNVAEAFLGSAQVVAGQTLNLAFVMTYMLNGDPAWV